MPTYLLVQRGEPTTLQPSPAQMEALFARHNAWKEKFKDKLVDFGGRLGGGAVVRHDSVTDGPHVEAKELIGGYMLITAANLDEAIAITRECTGVTDTGSYVEVREITVGGCADSPE